MTTMTHYRQEDRVVAVPIQPAVWVRLIDDVRWMTSTFTPVRPRPFESRALQTVPTSSGIMRYLPRCTVQGFPICCQSQTPHTIPRHSPFSVMKVGSSCGPGMVYSSHSFDHRFANLDPAGSDTALKSLAHSSVRGSRSMQSLATS